MANFCIFRTKKLKTDGNVGASVAHALRTRETPNADPARTPNNWNDWNKNPEKANRQAMARYRELLPDKIRKNGVRAIELLMTASPDAMQKKSRKQQLAYLNDCLHWAEDVFGKNNIFLKSVQFDETTPHLSMFLVPIDEKGKLNCRYFLGGREKLSQLQDNFYENVGKKHGLERGIKGSKAKHKTIRQYYQELKSLDKAITPPMKKTFENAETYAERYKQQLAPYFKIVSQTSRIKQQNDQYKILQNQAIDKQKKAFESQIQALQGELKRLGDYNAKLAKQINTWKSYSAEDFEKLAQVLKQAKIKNIKDLEKKEKQNNYERDN